MNEIKGAKDDHSHIAIYPATFKKFRTLRGGKDPKKKYLVVLHLKNATFDLLNNT